MTFNIKVPGWAKDIDHDGALIFLAFHAHVTNKYGEGWYEYHSPDVNTMIGLSLSEYAKWFYRKWPITKAYMSFGSPKSKALLVKMDLPDTERGGTYRMWVEKEITNERCIRTWCYLLGVMNHNVVAEGERAKTPYFTNYAVMEYSKLFKYSHSKYD